MKILLGATIALLLGALAVSFGWMKEGVRNTPPDEIARLQKQLSELQAEQEKLRLEKEMQQLRTQPPTPPAAEVEALREELARARQELQAAEEAPAVDDAALSQAEEGLLDQRNLEGRDTELRRARMISDALLIAKVREYAEDPSQPELGAFVILDILMPEQVQVGTVLAIRRKTGILGQLKVADISPEGAIANPMPGFGPIKPEVGDELILPPQY